LWGQFKRIATAKHDNYHGSYTCELDRMLWDYIQKHTHEAHISNGDDVIAKPNIYRVWDETKRWLIQSYPEYVIVPGLLIPRKHLVQAIGLARGNDPRTTKRWLNDFVTFKVLKIKDAGFEVLGEGEA
jgi:hypothetical protein